MLVVAAVGCVCTIMTYITTPLAAAPSAADQQVTTRQSSKSNPAEASTAVAVVAALVLAGTPASEIGVVSPYAAQVSQLESAARIGIGAALQADAPNQHQHARSCHLDVCVW